MQSGPFWTAAIHSGPLDQMKTTIGDTPSACRPPNATGNGWRAPTRVDNGDPFGIECAGATEADAIARLTGWLEWQHEHTAALEALQQAEHAYHRTIAGSAFASRPRDRRRSRLQKESLEPSKPRASGSTRSGCDRPSRDQCSAKACSGGARRMRLSQADVGAADEGPERLDARGRRDPQAVHVQGFSRARSRS